MSYADGVGDIGAIPIAPATAPAPTNKPMPKKTLLRADILCFAGSEIFGLERYALLFSL